MTRALAFLALGAAFVHCAHPTDDYEAYLDVVKKRTSNKPPPATCLGTPVTTDVDISGTYVGYCRVNFASAAQALRLATRFTKTGSSVEAKLTPLKVGAKTVNDTVGDPEVSATGTIEGGKFTLSVGTVKVSGTANPISGSDIELNNAVFQAVINSKEEILAELDGKLVKPLMQDLSAKDQTDFCMFVLLADGMTLPEPPPGDEELRCRNAGDGGVGGGGTGGAGGGSGTCTGSPGGDDTTLYCGKLRTEMPSISKCDDPMPSACAQAMCAVTGQALDCKKVLLDCYSDCGCNKAVACGAVCQALMDPNIDSTAICGPLAGATGLGKALNYKACAAKLTACGGDGSYDP